MPSHGSRNSLLSAGYSSHQPSGVPTDVTANERATQTGATPSQPLSRAQLNLRQALHRSKPTTVVSPSRNPIDRSRGQAPHDDLMRSPTGQAGRGPPPGASARAPLNPKRTDGRSRKIQKQYRSGGVSRGCRRPRLLGSRVRGPGAPRCGPGTLRPGRSLCGAGCGPGCGAPGGTWEDVWRARAHRTSVRGPRPPNINVCARRCPTLPHPSECSTIGAGSLSFRVRNGTGRETLPL